MTAQKTKNTSSSEGDGEPERQFSDAPVSIPEVRDKIIRMIGNSAEEMIKKTIVASENGQYLAMKYLFEMAGLHPANAAEEAEAEDSLSAILLRSLGIQEETCPGEAGLQTKVSKDSHADAGPDSDAVVK
jgi:hypothetical protein